MLLKLMTVLHKIPKRKTKCTFLCSYFLIFLIFLWTLFLVQTSYCSWIFIEHTIFYLYYSRYTSVHIFQYLLSVKPQTTQILHGHWHLSNIRIIIAGNRPIFNCLICSLCSVWFIDKTLRGISENPFLAIGLFRYFCPPCDFLKWTKSLSIESIRLHKMGW